VVEEKNQRDLLKGESIRLQQTQKREKSYTRRRNMKVEEKGPSINSGHTIFKCGGGEKITRLENGYDEMKERERQYA